MIIESYGEHGEIAALAVDAGAAAALHRIEAHPEVLLRTEAARHIRGQVDRRSALRADGKFIERCVRRTLRADVDGAP